MLSHVLRLIAALGLPADTVTVDPCPLIPMEQLRFVLTAGLGGAFPDRETSAGNTVSLADPKVGDISCPDLKVAVTLTLRDDPGQGTHPGSGPGTVRIQLALSTTATFAGGRGAAHTAAELGEAALCIRRVDSVDLKVERGPPWLTPAWLGARLGSELIGRVCIDVTSLVYVFLQHGGTLGGRVRRPEGSDGGLTEYWQG